MRSVKKPGQPNVATVAALILFIIGRMASKPAGRVKGA